MASNPVSELLEMEDTLNAAKTAKSSIRVCIDTWQNKKPLSKEHLWEVKGRLKKLKKTLKELDQAVKNFPVEFRPLSIDERIGYHNSLLAIPTRYLEKIGKYENGRAIRKDECMVYFADLHLLLGGIDDRAMAINNTIKLMEGDTTLEDLNGNSREMVKWADLYLSKGRDLPDKRASTIANLTWSYFNICTPVIKEDDSYIFDRVLIGHPHAWKTAYNETHKRGTQSLINYIENVYMRNVNYEGPIRVKRNGKPYQWWDYVCGPTMLHILFARQVLLMKLNERPNAMKERPTYVS